MSHHIKHLQRKHNEQNYKKHLLPWEYLGSQIKLDRMIISLLLDLEEEAQWGL